MKRKDIKVAIKTLKELCLVLKHSRLKKDKDRRSELPLYQEKLTYYVSLLNYIDNIEYKIEEGNEI
jgi:hypothetical protein